MVLSESFSLREKVGHQEMAGPDEGIRMGIIRIRIPSPAAHLLMGGTLSLGRGMRSAIPVERPTNGGQFRAASWR